MLLHTRATVRGIFPGSPVRVTIIWKFFTDRPIRLALGYCDLRGDGEIINCGGIRPGCRVNRLPVGGLVLVPDATSGRVCSHLNKAWIALEPTGSAPARGLAIEP